MRVIEPHQLYSLKRSKAIRSRKKIWKVSASIFLITLILIGSIGYLAYASPIPKVSATTVNVESKGTNFNLPWPTYGQSAVGAVGYGLLASSPKKAAAPTASIAKIMTALSVLKAKPLTVSQPGPIITLTAKDVESYNNYVAKNGSVVLVADGEQISERQALEAMLLPSSNNLSDTLAVWAFGSLKQYADYANKYAKELGLNSTVITSASGFPPETVSTASDLVKLGLEALNNPVIAAIVAMPTAKVPVAGLIHNVNFLLGKYNIMGIKTGDTDQAGGCYLFSAKRQVASGQYVTIVGAVMGATTLAQAMKDSLNLLNSGFQGFASRRLVSKGDNLGYYNLPWGGKAMASAENNLDVLAWKESDIHAQINLKKVAIGDKAGIKVGSVQTSQSNAALLLSTDIVAPKQSWRLSRWL